MPGRLFCASVAGRRFPACWKRFQGCTHLLEHESTVISGLWVVLVVATTLSCFFSLTGMALRAFRRSHLEEFLKEAGKNRLEFLERHLYALRLGASLGRVLANLTVVVAVMYLLGGLTSVWLSPVLAVLISGAIIAVFGLAIPQAWSSHAGERIVSATLPVLIFVRYLFSPIIAVMQAFEFPIRRLSGVMDEETENGDSAKQEILHAASEGQAEGAVEADEVEMIASVIEFGDTSVGEIMTPRTDTFAVPIDTPWKQAAAMIYEAGHSRVPVYEGDLDNIIGVLYAKDLLRLTGQQDEIGVRGLLRKPYVVPETKRLDDLLREFKTRKVHIAIILDEYGGTAGIVTIEDLIEEIVGEISDEYDQTTPALMKRTSETVVEVDGRIRVDEINEALDVEIPEEEDYDTIAGFVFSELGYIPAAGESLEAKGLRLTVLEADERKISRLCVEVLQTDERSEQQE